MQLGVTKPELKVQNEDPATNGKKLGSATTAKIAIYDGITATYVSMESPPALKDQKFYLKFSSFQFFLHLFGTSITLKIKSRLS